jgi:nucleotide-binding universal stress UspA family protein
MYKRLLVPLDGSTLAESALVHARLLAQQFKCELLLLRVVVSPYAIAAPDLILAGYDAGNESFVEAAAAYLRTVADTLQAEGLVVSVHTCEGPVAESILEHAAEHRADMIIMSTHGRGGVSRWVYGSVADRVLQAAACPVLLIRAEEK